MNCTILFICYFIQTIFFLLILFQSDADLISVLALLVAATLWTEIVMSCTDREGESWTMFKIALCSEE